ncbi:OadG family protein [Candidatus Arthromitus sp. SFB-rat-Yit]|uniref:OadG family protein n=1 Tax=Candidatus Arthromitus sp. SFB-rat-Yit TaxID=1041504 RepID=UPI000227A4FB|nr:OadG family protein [Candidatus Arthromitus sp. SFB-rat-Yit]BAK81580.1 sodium pump decarboxylase, gamma subunit subfamily [Candidatus Arthromitus sp. SFB-rat-Yit]
MDIGIKDAVILSIFCILIVFIVLMVISLGVNLVKIFLYSNNKISDKEKYVREVKKHIEDNHKIRFEDIDDENMLIAAFVASIDLVDEKNNKRVRIKSIKRL